MALENRNMDGEQTVDGALRRAEVTQQAGGLHIDHQFTRPGEDPYESVEFELRNSVITGSDGSIVFELKGVEGILPGGAELPEDKLLVSNKLMGWLHVWHEGKGMQCSVEEKKDSNGQYTSLFGLGLGRTPGLGLRLQSGLGH